MRTLSLATLRQNEVFAWVWWLGRIAVGLIALYASVYLIILGGVFSATTHELESPAIRIVSVDIDGELPWVRLQGLAPAYTLLEIGAYNTFLDDVAVGPIGQFNQTVTVPPHADKLWVRARNMEDMSVVGWKEIDLQEEIGLADPVPVITTAIFMEELQLLWIAGWAPPYAYFEVLDNKGQPLGFIHATEEAYFDALLPVAKDGLDLIRLRTSGGDSEITANVQPFFLASLPLERSSNFTWMAGGLSAEFVFVVPGSHPAVADLAGGNLPPWRFVQQFGGVPAAREAQFDITIDGYGDWVTVKISMALDHPAWGFGLRGGDGVGRLPLLTDRDCIRHRFEAGEPQRLLGIPPTGKADDMWTWCGPNRAVGETETMEFRLSSVEPRRALPPEQAASGAGSGQRERFREFVINYEDRIEGSMLARLWWTLIGLVPNIALLLLLRHLRFEPRTLWRPLVATALILAVWQSWPILIDLTQRGPGRWLSFGLGHLVYSGPDLFSGTGAEYLWDTIESHRNYAWDAVSTAFWLVFLALLVLVSTYFNFLKSAGLRWHPRFGGREHGFVLTWLGRIWKTVRLGYGALTLLVLLAVSNIVAVLVSGPGDIVEGQSVVVDLTAEFAGGIYNWWGYSDPRIALTLAVMLGLLLNFGLRAVLFGLGFTLITLRWVASGQAGEDDPSGFFNLLAQVPTEVFQAIFFVTAFPWIRRLIFVLAPLSHSGTRLGSVVAAALILVAMLFTQLAVKPALVGASIILISSLAWLTVNGLAQFRPVEGFANWARENHWGFALLLGASSILLGWPVEDSGRPLHYLDLSFLASELDNLFVYILAAGATLLLWNRAAATPGVIFDRGLVLFGVYFFAVFVVKSNVTWLLVPVPLLLGYLIARGWLLKSPADLTGLEDQSASAVRDTREVIQGLLSVTAARARFQAVRKKLDAQYGEAELTPQEYSDKLQAYRNDLDATVEEEQATDSNVAHESIFSVGAGDVQANVLEVLKVGAVLATVPFFISFYNYLPYGRVAYPYPFTNLMVFSVWAAASWLLYAVFFGFFLAHLPGKNGLTKGTFLSLAIAVPFAAKALLETQSLENMTPFFYWAVQVFLYCSLLGLLAVDYRLLRTGGYGIRELRVIHNIPALSAYASTALAAVASSVIALLTGRLNEVVEFFLKTVLPGVPGGTP